MILFVSCLIPESLSLSFPAPNHVLGLNCLWLRSRSWATILIQVICFCLDSFSSLCVCVCVPCLGPGADPDLGLEHSHSACRAHN